jgi:cutinase
MARSGLDFGILFLVVGCGSSEGGKAAQNQPASCTPFMAVACSCADGTQAQGTCSQDGKSVMNCACPVGTGAGGGGGAPFGTGGLSPQGGSPPFATGGFPQGGAAGIPQGGTAGIPEGGAGGVLPQGGAGGVLPQGGSGGVLPPESGGAAGAAGGVGEPDPTSDSAGKNGSLTSAQYTSGFADTPAYGAATIFYPTSGNPPFAGVAISPGFLEGQMTGWGPFLATHGFIALTFDTNTPTDQPPPRADALMAAIETLKSEAARQGSPIMGKLDTSRFAIMGHSMGGGGTLIAANAHSAELKAAVPLCPWEPGMTFPQITVPTMIIAGQSDTIAPIAQNATPHYASIPATTTKAYVEFTGADHFVANDPHTNATVGREALSWLKVFVDNDQRYKQFIKTESVLSKFDTTMK